MIHYGDLYWLNITFVQQSCEYVDKQIIYNHEGLSFNFNRFFVYSTHTNIDRTFLQYYKPLFFLLIQWYFPLYKVLPEITTHLIKHGTVN